MRKLVIAALALLCMMTIAAACNQKSEVPEHEQSSLNLQISKSEPDGRSYTVYKKILDNDTVTTVLDILSNASWEKGAVSVSMSRQQDYKIQTINLDPAVSYEPVRYDIWLSPQKDQLEVVIDKQSKYGKVSKKDTKKLLSILETP